MSAPVSKVFLLDKPAGISSFTALGALKRYIGTKKVGHAGTLDPFATGLLIAASGKMTKAAGMLTDMDKEYEAVFRFGAETDTLDTEGDIIAEGPIPEFVDITNATSQFLGLTTQSPPVFSAIKIDGRRAYTSARRGQDVVMPSRQVRIHDFEVKSWEAPDLRVRIRCSKGTYIRSVARDLGLACGSRAYCIELRRTAIGPFSIENALIASALDEHSGMSAGPFFTQVGMPIVEVDDIVANQMRHGIPFHRMLDIAIPDDKACLFVDNNGEAAAYVDITDGKPTYRIVFD